MRDVTTRLNGFTLIEILVVLALLSLIATMLPRGLDVLYQRSKHQALVQQTMGAVRACVLIAQQQQRSVHLGSQICPLPNDVADGDLVAELMLWFHANGTASRAAYIVVGSESDLTAKTTVIAIDKLTSRVVVQTDE